MMRRTWRSSLAALLLWAASGCNAIPITVPHDDGGVEALGDGMTDRGLIQDMHHNADIAWPSGDGASDATGTDAGMDGTTDALSDAVGEGVPLLDSLGEGLLDTGMLDPGMLD